MSVALVYSIVALAPSTVRPAPLAAPALPAPLATVIFKSVISKVVELIVVVVPRTVSPVELNDATFVPLTATLT